MIKKRDGPHFIVDRHLWVMEFWSCLESRGFREVFQILSGENTSYLYNQNSNGKLVQICLKQLKTTTNEILKRMHYLSGKFLFVIHEVNSIQ